MVCIINRDYNISGDTENNVIYFFLIKYKKNNRAFRLEPYHFCIGAKSDTQEHLYLFVQQLDCLSEKHSNFIYTLYELAAKPAHTPVLAKSLLSEACN